ncbi:MAG: PD-(D/E)XK nuclease family protein [Anaerolineae bacterium]|nr:PD-(D/E)XK nuclease family protein [Anaerolineae bacterium]
MPTLKPGQNLLLNNRLWSLWQVTPREGRRLDLEAIGASESAQGMTRRLAAVQYGLELFIAQRRGGYWRANLEHDWQETRSGPILEFHPATRLDLLDCHTQTPAQGELPNVFSWSYSRWAKYRTCSRAYYYHYYAAWEGWQPEAPEPVRTTYLLKNLTAIAPWMSTLVYESIRFALARLRAGQPIDNSDVVAQMHRRAQADFESSKSGRYQQKPNALIGFQEHYYNARLDASVWRSAWQQAENLLQTFLNAPLHADLQQSPASTFLDVETLHSFTLANTKVWVQMDLARFDGQTIEIYDWKSGAIDAAEVQRQLGVYGLYIRQAYPDWHRIPMKGIVYALAKDETIEVELNSTTLEAVETEVKDSIAEMRRLLTDAEANLTKIERFPMITDLTVCRTCQYRELCGRAENER